MPPTTSKTPADKAGASRNSCGGCFREALTPPVLQAQFLIAAYHVRPELAAMIAAIAFRGGPV